MTDEFAARSQEYEKRSSWVSDNVVCGHAIGLLGSGRKNLGDILDAGGGTGVLANAVASALPHGNVTVLDISPTMLAKVPPKFETVECEIESVAKLHRRFDTILLRQVLHYVADPSQVLRALLDVLSEDGVIYVGQIVAPDFVSAAWLQNIAGQISPNRKRVWEIGELMSNLFGAGMKLEAASLHTFTDTLGTWMQRSTVSLNRVQVLQTARRDITSTSKKSLVISEQEDDISFEALFFHGVFSKQH